MNEKHPDARGRLRARTANLPVHRAHLRPHLGLPLADEVLRVLLLREHVHETHRAGGGASRRLPREWRGASFFRANKIVSARGARQRFGSTNQRGAEAAGRCSPRGPPLRSEATPEPRVDARAFRTTCLTTWFRPRRCARGSSGRPRARSRVGPPRGPGSRQP